MRVLRVRALLLGVAGLAWAIGAVQLPSQAPETNWYKGNLHTHTINSDGDSAPDVVARWYKERRYNFLALTDHNYFSDPQGLNAFLGADERFLLMTGEEVTSRFEKAPVHVNAFRIRSTIEPVFGDSVLSTVQGNVDRIREAGAAPSLNHPFFRWGISSQVFNQITGLKLFEVFNGHPTTNDSGLEALWDSALSAGRQIYGIAVDDAHTFKQFSATESNPGRGWIEVRAADLSEASILTALDRGDFYSSTGIELKSLERGNGRLSFELEQSGDERFETRFVGSGGKVLATETGLAAQYRLKAGDKYVRASISDSNGRRAWIQPVFAE